MRLPADARLTPRPSMLMFAAAVLAIACLVALANWLFLSRVDPWTLVTAPLTWSHSPNTILGYSVLADGAPLHKENVSPLTQSLSFAGIQTHPDGYSLRSVYPFLVGLFSTVVALPNAAIAVNTVAYAALVVMTAWLAWIMSGSLAAAAFAGLLAFVGNGVIMHLNDMSAHMLGYAAYAAMVCGIYKSEVWRTRQPGVVHLGLGAALGLSTLVYPSGFLLIVGYVAVSLRRGQLLWVLLATAIAALARPGWEQVLKLAHATFFQASVIDLYRSDFGAAQGHSVNYWLKLLSSDVMGAARQVGRVLFDCLFVSFPALTILGLVAVVIVLWRDARQLFFWAVFLLLPYAGAVFFSPGAGSRGYLCYASAFILFSAMAVMIFPASEGRPIRRVAIAAAALVFAIQAAWSLSHHLGYFFPAIAFYVGWYGATDPFAVPTVVDFSTGSNAWSQFGGPKDFVAAGGLPLGIAQGNRRDTAQLRVRADDMRVPPELPHRVMHLVSRGAGAGKGAAVCPSRPRANAVVGSSARLDRRKHCHCRGRMALRAQRRCPICVGLVRQASRAATLHRDCNGLRCGSARGPRRVPATGIVDDVDARRGRCHRAQTARRRRGNRALGSASDSTLRVGAGSCPCGAGVQFTGTQAVAARLRRRERRDQRLAARCPWSQGDESAPGIGEHTVFPVMEFRVLERAKNTMRFVGY